MLSSQSGKRAPRPWALGCLKFQRGFDVRACETSSSRVDSSFARIVRSAGPWNAQTEIPSYNYPT